MIIQLDYNLLFTTAKLNNLIWFFEIFSFFKVNDIFFKNSPFSSTSFNFLNINV